jgi:methyl-accepting chemotaxis protein
MNSTLKRLLNPIAKYFQDIKNIEAIKQEEYTRGCTNTAIQFSENAKKQNEYINRLISENMKKIEELEQRNLEHEKTLREEYNKRINDLESRFTDSCSSCKKVTDEERKRINRLQDAIAEKLHLSDEIFRRLYNHATMISEEHTSIMQSTARALASKNELEQIQKEMNDLAKQVEKYLITELSSQVTEVAKPDFKVEEITKQEEKNEKREKSEKRNT